eukprot:gene11619-biopygen16881
MGNFLSIHPALYVIGCAGDPGRGGGRGRGQSAERSSLPPLPPGRRNVHPCPSPADRPGRRHDAGRGEGRGGRLAGQPSRAAHQPLV